MYTKASHNAVRPGVRRTICMCDKPCNDPPTFTHMAHDRLLRNHNTGCYVQVDTAFLSAMCIVCVGIMHVRTRRVNFGMAMWFGLLVSSDALEGGEDEGLQKQTLISGHKIAKRGGRGASVSAASAIGSDASPLAQIYSRLGSYSWAVLLTSIPRLLASNPEYDKVLFVTFRYIHTRTSLGD